MATAPFTLYQLPDGRIVQVDASAAKGALIIDYTLADGRIVYARRVNPAPRPVRHGAARFKRTFGGARS